MLWAMDPILLAALYVKSRSGSARPKLFKPRRKYDFLSTPREVRLVGVVFILQGPVGNLEIIERTMSVRDLFPFRALSGRIQPV